MEFKVGDVVYLKNDHKRLMTVTGVLGTKKYYGFKRVLEKLYRKIGFVDGDVQCNWFEMNRITASIFEADTLQLKSRTPPVKLKAGDIVYFKSNPEIFMTVTLVVGKTEILPGFLSKRFERRARKLGYVDGDVQCRWSNGGKSKIGLIKAVMVDKVENIKF